MRTILGAGLAALALTLTPIGQQARADAPPAAQAGGLKSTKASGVVTLAPGDVAGGRMVLRIVAYNSGGQPAVLSASAITITTVDGNAVGIVPLERLKREAQAAARQDGYGTPARSDTESNPSTAAAGTPDIPTGADGRPDLSNYHGTSMAAENSVNAATQNNRQARRAAAAKQLAETLDILDRSILRDVTIAPQTAGGGEVVTERIKFKRDETKAIKIAVAFNGETHVFTLKLSNWP